MVYFKPLRDGRWTSRCRRFDIERTQNGTYKTRLIRKSTSGPLLKSPVLLGEASTPWIARAHAEAWIAKHHPQEHTRGMMEINRKTGTPRFLRAGQ